MKKQTFIISIITLAIIIIAGVILFFRQKEQGDFYIDTAKIAKGKDFLLVDFNKDFFYQAIDQPESFKIKGHLRGAILPHHDLAADFIAKFFVQLAKNQTVDTFIILAPNHSDVAVWPAISTKTYWQTELGPIYNQSEILDSLFASKKVFYDEDNFSAEHSIKVLLPFIQNYFPQATIVPIIMTSKHDLSMSRSLAKELSPYLEDKNTVVISSLDFSHYLDLETAEKNDAIVLEAIKNKDYNLISNLNSDYLDSPPALITLLELMILVDSDDFELVDHSNSAYLLNNNFNTTSYLIGYFSN
ncbi:AmmeMemoRadiSam system protein B [Candidatus Parcubacteria bacterium]|nr:MAG: AmmeMemoRadiSam system protein B [Candidatus Parcubacteria bacterium]